MRVPAPPTWLFLVIAISAFFILLSRGPPAYGLAMAADNLIRCHEKPSDQHYWSWREIAGRKCWFRGSRGTPKSVLSWGHDNAGRGSDPVDDHTTRGPDADRPTAPADVIEPVQSIEIIGNFERAWRELMIDLYVMPDVDPKPAPWQ